jgi:hypothetical protein
MAAWGSHIDGAVMLVKLRGKKQLRTRVGSALFVAVRNLMVRLPIFPVQLHSNTSSPLIACRQAKGRTGASTRGDMMVKMAT